MTDHIPFAKRFEVSDTKLRGGYYTPDKIASFLARWAIRSESDHVLEPSCGDGQLIRAALERLGPTGSLTGIELDPQEARKARGLCNGVGTIKTADAFEWYRPRTRDGSFDAVIGNPPFIRYQSYPEAVRERAFELMRSSGLRPNRLTNAWVPFVVLAVRALRQGGRLGLVVPAELLQVSYAAELRAFLTREFKELTIVTFRELLFPGTQQETVLLLGVREPDAIARIGFAELQDPASLTMKAVNRPGSTADLDHAREKWIQYYLSTVELALVREIEAAGRFPALGSLADVDVGIVTGRNEFFVLRPSEARELGLERYCLRIIGRSAQIPALALGEEDWERLLAEDSKCLLLQLGDKPLDALSEEARRYISWGEERQIQKGYKCSIRLPNWWNVPSTWVPDAFLLRQISDGPRIIVNRVGATCTDTIHRVRVRDGVSPTALAAASANSLTFAFAEIRGRSYGGGVLELEPTEAEGLPIPSLDPALPLEELDLWARRKPIESLMDEVDRLTLREAGLSTAEIGRLREIWQKLYGRRRGRRRKR